MTIVLNSWDNNKNSKDLVYIITEMRENLSRLKQLVKEVFFERGYTSQDFLQLCIYNNPLVQLNSNLFKIFLISSAIIVLLATTNL